MRILVTNDDGIHAPGLKICEEIARKLSDDVWVVAPEHDQSGVSHSLSLNDPLRLRQVGERHYAVKGTPTDCVIMGARHIMKDMPDLVLSGVNRGRNAAEDVLYSGTVAAAKEAAVLGIPSFALSQALFVGDAPGAVLGRRAVAARARHHQPRAEGRHPARRAGQHQFPGLRAGRGEGRRGVEPGQARPATAAHRARATTGAAIRTTGSRSRAACSRPARNGTDLSALIDNRIAVTPLRLDLTDEPFMTKLAEIFPAKSK